MKIRIIFLVLVTGLIMPDLVNAFDFQRRLEVQYTIFREVLNKHGERIRLHKSLEVYGKPELGSRVRVKQWELNEAVTDAVAKYSGVAENQSLTAAIHGMVLSYSMGYKHEVQVVYKQQNEDARFSQLLKLELDAEKILTAN
jgi:hypothetical protein